MNHFHMIFTSFIFHLLGIEALHIASLLRDKGTVSVYGFDPVTSDHIQQKATLLGVNSILMHGVWSVDTWQVDLFVQDGVLNLHLRHTASSGSLLFSLGH